MIKEKFKKYQIIKLKGGKQKCYGVKNQKKRRKGSFQG